MIRKAIKPNVNNIRNRVFFWTKKNRNYGLLFIVLASFIGCATNQVIEVSDRDRPMKENVAAKSEDTGKRFYELRIASLKAGKYGYLTKVDDRYVFTNYAAHSSTLKDPQWVSLGTGWPVWASYISRNCLPLMNNTQGDYEKIKEVCADIKGKPFVTQDQVFDYISYSKAFRQAIEIAYSSGAIDDGSIEKMNYYDTSVISRKIIEKKYPASSEKEIKDNYKKLGLAVPDDLPSLWKSGLPSIRANTFSQMAEVYEGMPEIHERVLTRLHEININLREEVAKREEGIRLEKEGFAITKGAKYQASGINDASAVNTMDKQNEAIPATASISVSSKSEVSGLSSARIMRKLNQVVSIVEDSPEMNWYNLALYKQAKKATTAGRDAFISNINKTNQILSNTHSPITFKDLSKRFCSADQKGENRDVAMDMVSNYLLIYVDAEANNAKMKALKRGDTLSDKDAKLYAALLTSLDKTSYGNFDGCLKHYESILTLLERSSPKLFQP